MHAVATCSSCEHCECGSCQLLVLATVQSVVVCMHALQPGVLQVRVPPDEAGSQFGSPVCSSNPIDSPVLSYTITYGSG